MLSLINKAIQVAASSHDQQYRKTTNIPYISHPYSVGMLLMKNNCTEEVVAAGLLHDVVEDTPLTIEDIRLQFGDKVAAIVEGCSEPDKTLSWEERKQHTIDYLIDAPYEIKLVSCADKLHNLESTRLALLEYGDSVWDRFKRGREKQQWYYENVVNSLLQNLPENECQSFLFKELKTTFNTVFTKTHH